MMKVNLILSTLLWLCLILSNKNGGVMAQLSSEEESELGETELLVNEFLKGFRIEDINPKFFTCLLEQNRLRQ